MSCYRSAGRSVVALCALALSCVLSSPADAAVVQLSTHATGSGDPAELLATLEFEVSGNTLLITVTNDTAEPSAYRISEVLFNATSELTSLTPLTLPDGWSFATNQNANSFGQFDFRVSSGTGQNAPTINPGETKQYSFTFTGTGVTQETFLNEGSGSTRGGIIVAARFIHVQGGGGNAYGGTTQTPFIPEPGTAALLVIAYAISIKGRRRTDDRRAPLPL